MKTMLWAAAAATAFISTAAMATVTFDPNSGIGFVGKGDVQTAFGWNNTMLQKNASGVTFTFIENDRYDVTCEWTTTTGGPNPKEIVHDVTVTRHVGVNATISSNGRNNSNGLNGPNSGFMLNGFGSETDEGTVPVIGGYCPNGGGSTIVAVEQTSAEGGLFVNYGGNSVQLTF
jgi:hypothetical protein